jgi:hypothetical protein
VNSPLTHALSDWFHIAKTARFHAGDCRENFRVGFFADAQNPFGVGVFAVVILIFENFHLVHQG